MASGNLEVRVPSSANRHGDAAPSATPPSTRSPHQQGNAGGRGYGGATWQTQAKRRSHARMEGLASMTVAEARELRKSTEAEARKKQEDVRDLVGSRYSDFIEAADTISNMRSSAQQIIETATALADVSKKLVGGAWMTPPAPSSGPLGKVGKQAWASDAMAVLQTSELVHASIDSNRHMDAAVHLTRGRQLLEALRTSQLDSVARWRDMPFVKLQCEALKSPSLSSVVVSAASSYLRDTGLVGDDDDSGARAGDALAAVSLVMSHTVRDAMETFLEARGSCSKRLCSELANPREGCEELLREMQQLRRCLVQTVDVSFQLFAVGPGAEPLLPRLLAEAGAKESPGVGDQQCSEQCLAWAEGQALAAKAACRVALQSIASGRDLALVETALRSEAQNQAEDAWRRVTGASSWRLLFADAFAARAQQVVQARFSDIEVGAIVEVAMTPSKQAAPSGEGLGGHAGILPAAPGFFAARAPAGSVSHAGKAQSLPWGTLSNEAGSKFLSGLHAAVSECTGLVTSAGAGEEGAAVREERLLMLRQSCKEAVAGLSSLLGSKIASIDKRWSAGDTGDVAVSHALHIAQCAATVSLHVKYLFSLLEQDGGGADEVQEGVVHDMLSSLDAVKAKGHSIWVSSVAQRGATALRDGFKGLEGEPFWKSGQDLIKRWEEVDSQLTAEDGSIRSDRVPVPAVAMPHTFLFLFSSCSSAQSVADPPLERGTLELLATRLMTCLIDAYEGMPPSLLSHSDQLSLQLYFDFTFTLDVLAGHKGPQGIESRASRITQRLTSSIDPIDLEFIKPLVDLARSRAYQRASVVTGPLIQLKRLHLKGGAGSTSLPKPINILPVCAPMTRFGLLPAVDSWNVVGATSEEGEEGKGVGGGDDGDWRVVQEDSSGGHINSQLSQLGAKFGSWAAKGWTGLG